MGVRLDNIKLHLDESESKLHDIAVKRLGHEPAYFKILKKSLDARDKRSIVWVYSIYYSDSAPEEKPAPKRLEKAPRVAVIGAGPAGLMCSLRLLEHGFKVVIYERGSSVENRRDAVKAFMTDGLLDDNCNVQFGEGGAGTYSDGKLTTGTRDPNNAAVLEYFVRFGAPKDILYASKPHIGSDVLFTVMRNMRRQILRMGGEYRFDTLVTNLRVRNGNVHSILTREVKSGLLHEDLYDCVVLAVGHSARDTFEMLNKKNIAMESRDFAVGVRIEHLQEEISKAQYGESYKVLPPADYKAVSHAAERNVFSFCMCPGGVVIPAASEYGGVVTNGMSTRARDGINCNAGLMVQMRKEDFGEGLFAGMYFQRDLERRAYDFGGKNYKAPVQLVGDFLEGRVSSEFRSVNPTYACGTVFAPMEEIFPQIVTDSLKLAIPDIDSKIHGFASPDAVMTGVESRFSSPIKILRRPSGESVSLNGLYPCGEGSGYSGGIVSSAADGIGTAEKIFLKYDTV